MDKDRMILELAEKISSRTQCPTSIASEAAEIAWDFFMKYEGELFLQYFSEFSDLKERLKKIESFLVI